MQLGHLALLVCPECHADLAVGDVERQSDGAIEAGTLVCVSCARRYPIVRGVPRFVSSENYARGFGLQWAKHPRLQYDSFTGIDQTASRFFGQTGWPRRLEDETILEVGSGAGRFTEQALSTGATVVSVDYSEAVDVNFHNHRLHANVLIAQADAYRLPVRRHQFDRVFCFGVLQHTPDPERAFVELTTRVKPGGHIAIDVYLKYTGVKSLVDTKYWARPITRRMPPPLLYRVVHGYIRLMWPVARLLAQIPYVGTRINWKLLIADYSPLRLQDAQLREAAVLDTFDMLGPTYDYPQLPDAVDGWLQKSGLIDREVVVAGALVVARARTREGQVTDTIEPRAAAWA